MDRPKGLKAHALRNIFTGCKKHIYHPQKLYYISTKNAIQHPNENDGKALGMQDGRNNKEDTRTGYPLCYLYLGVYLGKKRKAATF